MNESVEVRLARIEEKLDALTEKLTTEVSSRLDDHAKRLSHLEARQTWVIGWVAGAVAFGAALEWFMGRMQ